MRFYDWYSPESMGDIFIMARTVNESKKKIMIIGNSYYGCIITNADVEWNDDRMEGMVFDLYLRN